PVTVRRTVAMPVHPGAKQTVGVKESGPVPLKPTQLGDGSLTTVQCGVPLLLLVPSSGAKHEGPEAAWQMSPPSAPADATAIGSGLTVTKQSSGLVPFGPSTWA